MTATRVFSLPPNDSQDPVQQFVSQDEIQRGGLSDIVESYGNSNEIPETPWLIQLNLEKSRRSTRCLGERTRLIKRMSDIVISFSMLILLLPVMLLTAILVKLTSPGEAIFKQVRVGLDQRNRYKDRRKNDSTVPGPPDKKERRHPKSGRREELGYGKPFTLYKFRTMRQDAEKNGAQFAQKNDARLTAIGGFLRKTRLDEFPQLWNVLKGEMSMVGPRPERPIFIEELSEKIPNYLERLGLKPGLTGVAQVVNGYDNDTEGFRRKVAFDLLYLQNCCFLNDCKILFRTIWVVIARKGI